MFLLTRYASNRRKGACPRRYDHATYLVAKGAYPEEKQFWKGMGLRNPDEIRIEDHIPPVGGLWTIANLSHDIAVFTDPNLPEGTGILNHICYNVDSREEVLLALDWFVENGYKSVWGQPTRHKADEGFFFYIMEPHTGVLLEIYACARLIFAPTMALMFITSKIIRTTPGAMPARSRKWTKEKLAA